MSYLLKYLNFMLIGLFVAFVVFLLIPLDAPSESQTDESSGIACGGFAGRECPLGFECVYPEPVYPDMMGTCRPGLSGETQAGVFGFINKAGNTLIEINRSTRSAIWSLWQKIIPNRVPSRGPAY